MTNRTKICRRCLHRRNLSEFPPNSHTKDKRSSWCKPCYRQYHHDRNISYDGGATESTAEWVRSQRLARDRKWRALRKQETLAYGHPLKHDERLGILGLSLADRRAAMLERIRSRRAATQTLLYGCPLSAEEEAALYLFIQKFQSIHSYYPAPYQKRKFYFDLPCFSDGSNPDAPNPPNPSDPGPGVPDDWYMTDPEPSEAPDHSEPPPAPSKLSLSREPRPPPEGATI